MSVRLNKKQFYFFGLLSGFLIAPLLIYIFSVKTFSITLSKSVLVVTFVMFLCGVFLIIYQIPNFFIDEKELKKESLATFRVELCNLDFSKLFICVSIPLVRITFYPEFFVIVIFFKVFSFNYSQVLQIEKMKIKFSEKIVIKTTDDELKEFSVYSRNQRKLYSILVTQCQKNQTGHDTVWEGK